jgi:hypothetical protein
MRGFPDTTDNSKRAPTATEAAAFLLGQKQGVQRCIELLDELRGFLTPGEPSMSDEGTIALLALRGRLRKHAETIGADVPKPRS